MLKHTDEAEKNGDVVYCDAYQCAELVCRACYAAAGASGEHQCAHAQTCLRVATRTGKLRKGKQKKTAVYCGNDLKKCPSCNTMSCVSCRADMWYCRCISHGPTDCDGYVRDVCHACTVKCTACRRELLRKHALVIAGNKYACRNAWCKATIEAVHCADAAGAIGEL